MLIQFSVTNFCSFLNKQTINMAASGIKEAELKNNVITDETTSKKQSLLSSAAIYGHNGSGKTTLIKAIKLMKKTVINSAKESQAGELINTTPFKLTQASREADSEFEIIFIEGGVRYQYGFRCNKERFTEEWLFAKANRQTQKWFQRIYDPKSQNDNFKFAKSFAGGKRREDWQADTRPNALFLSTALQRNNKQLLPVLNWFVKKLHIFSHNELSMNYTIKKLDEDKNSLSRKKIIALVKSLDLNIEDLQLKKHTININEFPKEPPKGVPKSLHDKIINSLKNKEVTDIAYIHHDTETGTPIEINENEMSAGTKSLVAFAGPWLDVIDNDRVLIIDELDKSLHPLIVRQLVEMINKSQSKAQLIFTTHDTSVLSQKILRRDQVWFTEKDDKKSSCLYSLAEFSPRKDEAIERKYLNGRYGGIPFIKDLDFYG